MVDSAFGDQVVAAGKNYAGAEIVTMQDGVLQVRTSESLTVRVPLGTVELLVVDRPTFDDLNEAERLVAAGELQKAVVRYERALRLASGFWTDVVRARFLAAEDRLGRLDEAVHHLIQLVQSRWSGPAAVATMLPLDAPVHRNARLARSMREIDVALATQPPEDQVAVLALLQFDLLHRGSDRRMAGAAAGAVRLGVPPDVRTPAVYRIFFAALATVLDGQPGEAAWAALDRAIEHCPEENLPDFLLLKGRVLLRGAETRDEIIRASWPLMRVAIHMPDDPRAAEGLLGTARALDRLGRPQQVRALLNECLAHASASSSVLDEARAMLVRVDERGTKP